MERRFPREGDMGEWITASQTVGPFFKDGLAWKDGDRGFPPGTPGRRIAVEGRVVDGNGDPVPDALLEFWQPDASGAFGGPTPGSCAGFGRVPTDGDGRFAFATVLPGRVPGADGALQAPHLAVTVHARGLTHHLHTRVYFAGEAANAGDAVLKLAGPRAATLVAQRAAGEGAGYRWDVVLQGPHETVFLEV
jgi:protocatechuate 3,4-dioxygenase alpha subunit